MFPFWGPPFGPCVAGVSTRFRRSPGGAEGQSVADATVEAFAGRLGINEASWGGGGAKARVLVFEPGSARCIVINAIYIYIYVYIYIYMYSIYIYICIYVCMYLSQGHVLVFTYIIYLYIDVCRYTYRRAHWF